MKTECYCYSGFGRVLVGYSRGFDPKNMELTVVEEYKKCIECDGTGFVFKITDND